MENNTKKQRLFNLPETKGNFQIKGVVKGTKKNNFYTEKQTRTGKEMRIVNFGLELSRRKFTSIRSQKKKARKEHHSRYPGQTDLSLQKIQKTKDLDSLVKTLDLLK